MLGCSRPVPAVPETEDGCTTSGSNGRDGSPADPPHYESTVLNWRQATRSRWPQIGRCACGVRGDDADQPPALVVGTCPVRPLALSADVSQVRKRPGRVAAPGRSARRPVPYRLAASRDALVVCVQGFPHRGGRVTCCPDRDRLGYRRPRPLCIRRCCTAGMAADASLRKPRGCSRSLCIGRCRSRRRFLPGLDWPSGAISFRSWVEDRFPDSHPLNLQ
jgi:hypothetical protein